MKEEGILEMNEDEIVEFVKDRTRVFQEKKSSGYNMEQPTKTYRNSLRIASNSLLLKLLMGKDKELWEQVGTIVITDMKKIEGDMYV